MPAVKKKIIKAFPEIQSMIEKENDVGIHAISRVSVSLASFDLHFISAPIPFPYDVRSQ